MLIRLGYELSFDVPLAVPVAVSYTHLDVYKRQLLDRTVGTPQGKWHAAKTLISDANLIWILHGGAGADL